MPAQNNKIENYHFVNYMNSNSSNARQGRFIDGMTEGSVEVLVMGKMNFLTTDPMICQLLRCTMSCDTTSLYYLVLRGAETTVVRGDLTHLISIFRGDNQFGLHNLFWLIHTNDSLVGPTIRLKTMCLNHTISCWNAQERRQRATTRMNRSFIIDHHVGCERGMSQETIINCDITRQTCDQHDPDERMNERTTRTISERL